MTTSPTDPLRETSATQPTRPIEQPPTEPTTEPQKEFRGPETLEPSKPGMQQKPSPMDIARETATAQEITPEKVQNQADQLQKKFLALGEDLKNPPKPLTDEHYQALQTVASQAEKNMQAAARHSGAEHTVVEQKSGQSVKDFLIEWVDGGQKTMGNVLESLPNMQAGDMTGMMRVQVSMQRASQRAELMASIISATVGGIKTLMSTQLG